MLLQAIADAGGGHYYYIGHPDQIGDFMTSELGELLETVAREVVVDVKHNPLLEIEPLSPVVAAAAVPGELRLLLGDLVAGQRVELVLRLRFPAVEAGNHTNAFFTIGDRDGVLKADGATLAWTHAEDADVDAQPRDADVDRAVARLYAARARAEAVRLNRVGDYAGARHALSGVAMRVAQLRGHGCGARRDLVAELRDEEVRVQHVRCARMEREHAALLVADRSSARATRGAVRSIRALPTLERTDRYVRLSLDVLAEGPDVGTEVDLLHGHGAHTAAQEEVWVIAVDGSSIRSAACVARGDYHAVSVPLPALLAVPLLAGANRAVLAHNHPSGRLIPSKHDFALTESVVKALNAVGIILEDHLILAPDGRHASFKALDLLEVPEFEPTTLRA